MSTLPQVAQRVETLLSTRANEGAEQTGFVQRSTAQLDGAVFAQTTVLRWMHDPQAG